MVKILVIQLDRFGDIMYTTPLITALRKTHSPCHVSVMTTREGVEVIEGNPDIDENIVADWLDIPKELPEIDGRSIFEGYQRLARVVADLRARGFNYVYNMNFKKMTTLLAYLISAPETVGFTLSPDGARVIKGPWVNYLSALIQSRKYNLFNIADIFRKFEPEAPPIAKPVFQIPEEVKSRVKDSLGSAGVEDDDLVIGFQVAASSPKKVWPSKYFAKLGDSLIEERGAKILLFGTEQEREIGREVEGKMRYPVINLMGKTTIPELAACLERCKCLVSNDTGTMHLAAAVGTKVAGLSFSFVHFAETSSYGEGNLVFQPDIPCAPCSSKMECHEGNRCLDLVSPESVFRVLHSWLDWSNGQPAQIEDTADLEQMNVYYSLFDGFGFLTYFPLIKRPLKADDILNLAYKLMWLDVLGAEGDFTKRREYIENSLKHYFIDKSNGFSMRLIDSISELETLSDKGIGKTRELLDILIQGQLDPGKVNGIVEQLNRIDQETEAKGIVQTELVPLIMAFSLDKQNLEGGNIYQLARETLSVYEGAKRRGSLLKTYLAETLATMWRP
ncbi:MAG: glycosyltransferase family 9 protein [Pseudomonadota bacterium]